VVEHKSAAPVAVGVSLSFNNQGKTVFRSSEICNKTISCYDDWKSVTISSSSLAANPANSVLHTRMGAFGKLFARYRAKRVRLNFSPAVGTNSAGILYLVYYADPKTPAPISAADASKATKVVSGPIWSPQTLVVDVDQNQPRLMTRTGDNTIAGPENDYGVWYAFAIGPTVIAALGTLSCAFDYEMYDPVEEALAPI
jgi:hypothetical protein